MTFGRKALFACLYLSEGAPIGFLWLALPTQLRAAGVGIESITWLTAILVLPWTFKFAWAPLIDVMRSPRWSLKHWIVSAQVVMGLTLLPLLWLDPVSQFQTLASLLFVHAISAATQDVAIDAFCISTTAPEERGSINGWMQTGSLIGRAALGGGALVAAPYLGEQTVIVALICVTTFSAFLVMSTDMSLSSKSNSYKSNSYKNDPVDSGSTEKSGLAPTGLADADIMLAGRQASEKQAYSREVQPTTTSGPGRLATNVRKALAERNTWVGLLFALTGAATFKALEVLYGPFLIDRGFTKEEVGSFAALPMIGLMIVGSLLGGRLSDRFGRRTLVAGSLLLACAGVVSLCVFDLTLDMHRSGLLLGCLAVIAFGIGLFTAASYALFMDITHPAVAATQFSAFMGLTNGCESWTTWTAGKIIAGAGGSDAGYPTALLCLTGVSILSLLLLPLISTDRWRGESAIAAK